LAFASWASSFAALATSRSFSRRSWAISLATAATCRTRVASAPAPAPRVRGAAPELSEPGVNVSAHRAPTVRSTGRRVAWRTTWGRGRCATSAGTGHVGESSGCSSESTMVRITPYPDHICFSVTDRARAVSCGADGAPAARHPYRAATPPRGTQPACCPASELRRRAAAAATRRR
jgi:hypothetical protein